MGTRSFGDDTFAMSESIGVGLLIGMTVIVTAVVGLNVLVAEEDGSGGPEANFTYEYVGESEILIVTHSRGDSFEAGSLEFNGPGGNVTWAALANRNESAQIEPGDITQLGSENAYGSRVSQRDTITIYYNRNGNQTQLDQWAGE